MLYPLISSTRFFLCEFNIYLFQCVVAFCTKWIQYVTISYPSLTDSVHSAKRGSQILWYRGPPKNIHKCRSVKNAGLIIIEDPFQLYVDSRNSQLLYVYNKM
jgi:hypothetical protein